MNTRLLAVVLAISVAAPGPLTRLFPRLGSGQSCPPGSSRCPDNSNVVDQPNPAAVEVISHVGGMKYLGSGILVAPDQVLTAAHTFSRTPDRVEVVFPDGRRINATLAKRAQADDLALLLIPVSTVPPCPVADEDPASGVLLVASGYGDSSERFRSVRGALRSHSADGRSLTMAGLARGGDSGGPILDAAGQLVGIVTHTGSGIIRGVCRKRICDFLGRSPTPTPTPDPVPDATDPPVVGTDRIDTLEARVDLLESQIALLVASMPVEPGEIDLDALIERLPGITFQAVGDDGASLSDPVTRRLGETLKMHHFRVETPN